MILNPTTYDLDGIVSEFENHPCGYHKINPGGQYAVAHAARSIEHVLRRQKNAKRTVNPAKNDIENTMKLCGQ